MKFDVEDKKNYNNCFNMQLIRHKESKNCSNRLDSWHIILTFSSPFSPSDSIAYSHHSSLLALLKIAREVSPTYNKVNFHRKFQTIHRFSIINTMSECLSPKTSTPFSKNFPKITKRSESDNSNNQIANHIGKSIADSLFLWKLILL
jgi:hypothetical protein